ncbi:uncharacterized protein DSM5745_04905 [Aspergillus mulundensis]|uniref:Prolyl 4-hydroxylase alpha subunit domain-containing protein n=1 Tax=Aspergillus mulundensis TaxID=1810919 RepID=A0A3D8S4Z3_9EURO|nr:Uncharacterized protein DSM5745_04905 [Aspergillus mulundensis]RDW81348.1 Uncharacterized protein DSM5745_04905 [Aspergillus mulundensis]
MPYQKTSDFLPPQPPASAHCQVIDFAATNPALPEYKRYLAAVIDNALTESECKELLRIAEASTPDGQTWERAMINIGGGRQKISTESRNCGRIILDDSEIADKLQARLMPFLRELGIERLENRPLVTGLAGRNKTYQLTKFNERLRFLKYVGGEYFRPHWDAHYTTPDKRERSYFTVHLYLNGDGEQDLTELKRATDAEVEGEAKNIDLDGPLLGGATSFLPRYEEKERHVRVFPRTGSVLVFQQSELLHGGDSVFRGTKFTLRTDVMYELVE